MSKKISNIIAFLFVGIISYAQEKNQEDTNEISQDACLCLSEIDVTIGLTEKYEEIKTCISTSILTNQVNKTLINPTRKLLDSLNASEKLKDTVAVPIKNRNIIILDQNYKAIEEKLLRECEAMSKLLNTDEKMSEVSVSDKQKAIDFYNEGSVYLGKGDYDNAIKAFKKAVRKDRNFAFAWDNIGISYRKKGAYKDAIKAYRTSIKIDPTGRVPLMNLPIAQELMKDYDGAIASYKDFISVFKDDAEGYYGIGRIYHLKGDYRNALDNTMKAYIMYNKVNSPYARDAEANLGLFYRELKEKDNLDLFFEMAKKNKIEIGN